jgi:copper(I)-binding protein
MMNRSLAALGAMLLTALPIGAGAGSSIVVGNIWSRPATTTAVVYGTIRNGGSSGDELIGANAPGAQHTELHETSEGHAGTSSSNGAMQNMPMTVSMKRVNAIPVPAGGTLNLSPGGYHIMLIGLSRSWKLGDAFEIRLHFKKAGWIRTNGSVTSP